MRTLLVCAVLCAAIVAAKKKQECKDDEKGCSSWADAGECTANPGFMHASCKQSCGLCPMTDLEKKRFQVKSWFRATESGSVPSLEALRAENGGCIKQGHPTFGQSALHRAATSGQADIARWLIETCNADPDDKEPEYGITPMHLAAVKGYTDVLNVLLIKGANPSPVDNFERTPDSIAENKGHKDFARAVQAHLKFNAIEDHAYSEEYLEEVKMMDEL